MKDYRFKQMLFSIAAAILALFTSSLFGAVSPKQPAWAIRYTNLTASVLLDGAGNSYLAGTPYAGHPMTVVKVTPQGQTAWTTKLDETAFPAYPNAMTVDPLGNLYVAGATFAPNPAEPLNYQDFVTYRFSSQGQLLWRVAYDPPDGTLDWGNGIGRDNDGNLYVVGRSYAADIPGAYDTVLKYGADGHLLWTRRFERATNSTPHNNGTMAVNPHGGVAAVGNRTVVSYSGSGDLLWSWEGPASETTAAFDDQDHLYILSSQWTGVTFDSAVLKFSPGGDVLWRASHISPAGVEGRTEMVDLKIDPLGNAYVAANSPIGCRIIVDDGETELRCDNVPLIVKFGPDGRQLWATRFFTPSNTFPEVTGLALGVTGEPHLAVRVYRFDAEDDTYFPAEGFVAKCDSRGNQIWSAAYRSPDTSRTLFFLQPSVDRLGRLLVSAELIDYSVSAIDMLLLQYAPEQPRHAPNIVSAPTAQTVAAGGTVTFGVSAAGVGRLGYQWRFNSRPIPGATAASLTLANLQLDQAGDYSVEVRNQFGTVVTPDARLTALP